MEKPNYMELVVPDSCDEDEPANKKSHTQSFHDHEAYKILIMPWFHAFLEENGFAIHYLEPSSIENLHKTWIKTQLSFCEMRCKQAEFNLKLINFRILILRNWDVTSPTTHKGLSKETIGVVELGVKAKRLREEEEDELKDCNWKRGKCVEDTRDDLSWNHNDFTNKGGFVKKESRHCELCGGGNDGRPAFPDSERNDGDNGFGHKNGWLGHLVGPIEDRSGIARIWVHYQCLVWSPEVYFAGPGRLKNVTTALNRGKLLKCSHCRKPGATLGCRVNQCQKTYHLACARANSCSFDHKEFLMACTDHRHIFPSNVAQQKNIEEEEIWIGNHDDKEIEGEDELLKRESKKHDRGLKKIAPTYIGGPNRKTESPGWESVGGLQHVIECMKELVFFPLLYPELFEGLGIEPPKGVLLHGYPGTGKTHVVRALIGSCARGDKQIAYFSLKGADCLGKHVGDAEKKLTLLFQAAEEYQPSIIFFDEIDGLAPCRTRKQDQTYNSVVSTLLALLDGLKSRGCVIVIGATNRPENVDPALRRPGRFDREIYFPLPSLEDRSAILSLYTQNWPKPLEPNGPLIKWISRDTSGFAGADLQALCTQTAIIALKRSFPLKQVLSADSTSIDIPLSLPIVVAEERDWLEALSSCPAPCSRRDVGMAANHVISSPLPSHLIPCLLRPLSTLLVSLGLDERICLPNTLTKAATIIKSVIVTALNRKAMVSNKWWSHVDDLIQEYEVASEIERRLHGSGVNLLEDSDIPNLDKFIQQDTTSPSQFDKGNSRGFRILIAGNPRAGQRHLASCIVNCFVEHVEIRKVDVTTISQGHDLMQGITNVLQNSSTRGKCLVFMPRIDLWAIQTHYDLILEEGDSHPTDEQCPKMAEHQSTSRAWSLFIAQVESLPLSTHLIILATSEVPFLLLPREIRHFFKNSLSISGKIAALEHTIPRFSVQVNGNFDHDLVINQSALKLSRDIVKFLVQLIHQKCHMNNTSAFDKCQSCDSVEEHTRTINFQTDKESISEHIGEAKSFKKSSLRFFLPEDKNNPTSRGKVILLSAITTFGYQILQNSYFSSLCHATSKLKEGPSIKISKSHWKGWEFNSCVFHLTSSFDNVKTKDNYVTVKGLVAIGLSAIRGVYTSLKDVCSDVRFVLHLLVEQINARVDAGQDRLQYTCVLSEVASLRDMVDNWAYMLRSLEQDSPRNEMSRNNSSISNQFHGKKTIDEKVENVSVSNVNMNPSSTKVGQSSLSTTVCSVNCCSECLSTLHVVTKKILMHEFGVRGFDWSAERVHDIFMKVSVDLFTAMRKSFVEGSGSYLYDEKQREENFDKLLESYDLDTCCCKSSRNMIVIPIECSCHLPKQTVSSEVNASPLAQRKLNSKFMFSNGVLVDVDSKKDVSFHCKFETMCLSSLMQFIVMIKKSFN